MFSYDPPIPVNAPLRRLDIASLVILAIHLALPAAVWEFVRDRCGGNAAARKYNDELWFWLVFASAAYITTMIWRLVAHRISSLSADPKANWRRLQRLSLALVSIPLAWSALLVFEATGCGQRLIMWL